MEFLRETETRKNLIKVLADAATAESESDVNRLLNLFEPNSSRKIAGEEFREVLGYNPVTYWDMKDTIKVLDDIFTAAAISRSAQNIISMEKLRIAERAMEIYDANREDNLKEAVAQALGEFFEDDDANRASVYLTGVGLATLAVDGDDDEGEDDDIDLNELGDSSDLDDIGNFGDPEEEFDIEEDSEEEDDG